MTKNNQGFMFFVVKFTIHIHDKECSLSDEVFLVIKQKSNVSAKCIKLC